MTSGNLKNIRVGALAVAALALSASLAVAQSYPTKQMTVLCGFAAGGGGDIICRYYAEKIAARSGQTAIVENKVGALGALAASAVARAKPDGYTILVTPGTATHASHQVVFAKPHYDPVKDFTFVTTLNRTPFFLVTNPKIVPANTVRELADWGKSKQGKVKTGGSTTTSILASEILRQATGMDLIHASYKSAQVAMTDLTAGELDFAFCDPGLAIGYIQSGAVRPLAVASPVRSTILTDIPTMGEAGYQGFEMAGWWAAYLPAKTPEPIVTKLRQWLDEIVLSDDAKQFFRNAGIDMFPRGDLDLVKFQASETEKYARLYKLANIQPQ